MHFVQSCGRLLGFLLKTCHDLCTQEVELLHRIVDLNGHLFKLLFEHVDLLYGTVLQPFHSLGCVLPFLINVLDNAGQIVRHLAFRLSNMFDHLDTPKVTRTHVRTHTTSVST